MIFFSEKQLLIALAAALILIFHLIYLLRTGKAQLTPLGQGTIACCGDSREDAIREMTVFGGASAFDWGIMYWLIALISKGAIKDLAIAYALMRTFATALQTIGFINQARKIKGHETIKLKAHLEGCTYTTTASPLWWLYWLGKINPLKNVIVNIRDWITQLDFFFSIPGLALLNLLSQIFASKNVQSIIGPTAFSQSHANRAP